jgi:hypothetical protein
LGIGDWGFGPIPNPQTPMILLKQIFHVLIQNIILLKLFQYI